MMLDLDDKMGPVINPGHFASNLFINVSNVLGYEQFFENRRERFIAYPLMFDDKPVLYHLPKNSSELSELLSSAFALAGFNLLGEDEKRSIKCGDNSAKKTVQLFLQYLPETAPDSTSTVSQNIVHHALRNTAYSLELITKKLNGQVCETDPWDNPQNPVLSRVHQAVTLADRMFFCPHMLSAEKVKQLGAIINNSGSAKEREAAANLLINQHAYTINPTQSYCGQTVTGSIINYFYDVILAAINPGFIYEIGTGTGCQLANTSLLLPGSQIISVEHFEELAECARKNLGEMYNSYDGIMEISKHFEMINGDGFDFKQHLKKWDGARPDLIYLCAAIKEDDARLGFALENLRNKGFLLAPVKAAQSLFQTLSLYHNNDGKIARLDLSYVDFGMML